MKPDHDLLGMAESIIAKAPRLGAPSAEAFVLRSVSGSVRIEKNEIGGVETDTSFGIGIRVLKEARVGFAFVTRPEQAAQGIKDAVDAAKLSIRLPKFSFPAPRRMPKVAGLFDARIEGLEAPQAIERAKLMARSARDADKGLNVTEAGISYGSAHSAIANTEGLAVQQRETSVSASCFVVQSQTGVSTGFASRSSTRLDLDMARLGADAADLALRARRPVKLEKPVSWPIVVRPESSGDLISTITIPSVYGKPAHRDESYYSGKLGKKVADSRFSLIDDPTRPNGLGSAPFDDEGEPSSVFAPIRNGVLKGFLFDAASGAEYGAKTTGSAVRVHPFDGRSHKSPPTTSGRNLIVQAPSRSTEKLVAGVDEGLLVHDMLGVHTANTVSGDFSVTSSLLFRIKKGAIEGPLAPVSIGGNFHKAIARGFTMGDDLKQVADEGALTVPSCRFDGFTITP